MGVMIACWSYWHGRGNTANAIAIASQLSMRKECRVAFTHTQYIRANMENAFLNGKESDDLLKMTDTGIDSLERALLTGNLKKTDFTAYCNKVNDRLYLLPGSKKTDKNIFEQSIGDAIEKICAYTKDSNDITVVDVSSGNDETAKKVLDMADITVVTIDQSYNACEDFFKNRINNFNPEKTLIVIGRYDPESKFSKEYIKKAYNVPVFAVHELTEYLDAMNNHRVNKLFETYYFMNEYPFFADLNEIVDVISQIIEDNYPQIQLVERIAGQGKKKGFFSGFRN